LIPVEPFVHPQARAFIESIPDQGLMARRDIEEVRREAFEIVRAAAGKPEPMKTVDEIDVGGVRARLYWPAGGEKSVLVWIHGGAFMTGDLDSCDVVARAFAKRAQCAVLSVDYRLAPENRFPAAIDDAWRATVWASKRFDKVAVGGDSAGGNLAAAVALRARDFNLVLVMQVLVYPVLSSDTTNSYYETFPQRYANFCGRKAFGATSLANIRNMWETYVPDPTQRLLQDASPMRAASVLGLAPVLMILAEHDILREDGEEYIRRLERSGVPVEVHRYEGQLHGFMTFLGKLDAGQDAVDKSAAALRIVFGPEVS
jgi:acetyl esterase/lipase